MKKIFLCAMIVTTLIGTSCTKQRVDAPAPASPEKIYIRVVGVSNDGTSDYSPIMLVR